MLTHNSHFVSVPICRAMRLLLAASCCMVIAVLTQTQVQAEDFFVPGRSGPAWVDTGLDIGPGTLLQLSATGVVDVSAGWGSHGPNGTPNFANVTGYPVPGEAMRYGLVACLTASTPVEPLREMCTPRDRLAGLSEMYSYPMGWILTVRRSRLWLTVNDDNPGDNSGFFKVHLDQTIFPPDQMLCHACPFDKIDWKALRNAYPDPKGFQGLLLLHGQITAVKHSGDTTRVSVSQDSVLAKYGDLPNLKVVFTRDKARPLTSLSKENVIQGVLFKKDKMSLIMGDAYLYKKFNPR